MNGKLIFSRPSPFGEVFCMLVRLVFGAFVEIPQAEMPEASPNNFEIQTRRNTFDWIGKR
jgi:hypothetical protein